MCEDKGHGGVRCAGHTRPQLEAKLAAFQRAYPGAPSPCALMSAEAATERRIGVLHGHVKVAEHQLRVAETAEDREAAAEYLAAARARLAARWAERDGVAQAATLADDEQAAYDIAETSRQYAETRCEAYALAADRYLTIDDVKADRYDSLSAHYRAEADQHAAVQEQILGGARPRRAAPASGPAPTADEAAFVAEHGPADLPTFRRLSRAADEAPFEEAARETTPVRLAPRHAELAYLRQHQPASYAMNEDETRAVLGVDHAGLAALEAAGHLPRATNAGSGRVAMYALGDVARVAGRAAERERVAA